MVKGHIILPSRDGRIQLKVIGKKRITQTNPMTFIEFKKTLLDAGISLPKFCKLIKVSDKNLQSYKKKGDVPNTIAVIVTCFARMHQEGIDYREMVDQLQLKKQKKTGGFKKKSLPPDSLGQETALVSETGNSNARELKEEKRKKADLK